MINCSFWRAGITRNTNLGSILKKSSFSAEMKSITKTLLLLSVIGLTVASPVEYEALDTGIVVQAEGDEDYRLTRDVLPSKYEIQITPHFKDVKSKFVTMKWKGFDQKLIIRKMARQPGHSMEQSKSHSKLQKRASGTLLSIRITWKSPLTPSVVPTVLTAD
jgi:hypothetical protein